MGDSQRFAPENLPQIAKIIVIHQNFADIVEKQFCILAHTCASWCAVSLHLLGDEDQGDDKDDDDDDEELDKPGRKC